MKRVQREGKQPAGGVQQELAPRHPGGGRMLEETLPEGCFGERWCQKDVWWDAAPVLQHWPLMPQGPCLCSEMCVGPFGKGHSTVSCCPWDVPNHPLAGDAECMDAAQADLGMSLGVLTL